MISEKKRSKKRKRAYAVVDLVECTGCEVCVTVCPVRCISTIESDLNFTGGVEIDTEICTGCNLCAIDCPWETIFMVNPDGSFSDYSQQLAKARNYS